MEFNTHEIIGVIGAMLYLYSYASVQLKRAYARTFEYSALNFLAALFVLISLTSYWNLASAIIQISWILISLYGLFKCYRQYRTKKPRMKRSLS